MQANSLLSEPPGKIERILRSAPMVLTLLIDCGRTVYGIPGHCGKREGVGLPRWLSGKESAYQCRGTWVQSLGWDDALAEEMETTSIFLAGEYQEQRSSGDIVHWITKSRTQLSD